MCTNVRWKELTESAELLSAYEVYRDCMYQPTAEKYSRKVQSWLEDESVRVFACVEDGTVLGMLTLQLQEGNAAEIVGISVATDLRRQRLGTELIRIAAERLSLVTIYAETDADAAEFYEKVGFSMRKTVKVYNGEPITRYHCILQRKTSV